MCLISLLANCQTDRKILHPPGCKQLLRLLILGESVPIKIPVRRSDKGIACQLITGGISSVRAAQLAGCVSRKPERPRSLRCSITRLQLQLLSSARFLACAFDNLSPWNKPPSTGTLVDLFTREPSGRTN